MDRKKRKGEKKRITGKGVAVSVAGGLSSTILLVVVIPALANYLIQPIVENAIGETSIAWITSSTLVSIVMLAFMIPFMLVLGGSAILKRFGVIGVIALVAAYWLMGNLEGAVIPVLLIVIVAAWGYHRNMKKSGVFRARFPGPAIFNGYAEGNG